MFKSLIGFLKKHIVIIIGLLLIAFTAYTQFQSLVSPPELQQFKGGIQNKLVWSISGDCYFVRPANNSTVYLVSVSDCNRGK